MKDGYVTCLLILLADVTAHSAEVRLSLLVLYAFGKSFHVYYNFIVWPRT